MSESYENGGAGRSSGGRSPEEPGGARRAPGDASRLPEELRALGRSLDPPGASGTESMVERVLEQILAEQVPVPVAEPPGPATRVLAVRRWARMRRRSLTAALCGLLTVLVLTPPVRAAVVDWFGFGGVEVRYDPSGPHASPSPVPGCGQGLTVTEAAQRAGFEPLVPRELGRPTAAQVSGDRRVMSLCWRTGDGEVIRLDQFRATLSPLFWKSTRVPYEPATVNGDSGLWFAEPHRLELALIDDRGHEYARTVRTAGPTLLWQHREERTLRLEGVQSRERAVAVAESVE
ncbi:hypothetical protein G5C60_32950 [Streptomyces sp. HC44]|uniref:Uncharacterized protein n=1 Tax=Streptomyces scabichelini TaxID=2711217 RepID=A0A6G4VEP1_9ACTN|nr:hypothetical protein [Streptomyces scabichelini]